MIRMFAALSALALTALPALPAAAAPAEKPLSVVLVHDAFEDGSGWRPVYGRLTKTGVGAGVDVPGCWHWSAMDDFEWLFGPKLGRIAVDRKTPQRTPKPSARIVGDIARRNAI